MSIKDHFIKDFKLVFTNKTNYFMMILLPILTTLILGTVFAKQISQTKMFNNQIVGINVKNDKYGFAKNIDMILKEMGFKIEEGDKNSLEERVKENKVISYIEIDDMKLTLYKGKYEKMSNDAVELVLNEFKNRSEDMIITRGKADSSKTQEFTKDVTINPDITMSAFDYFGITQLTMILVNGNMAVFSFLFQERREGTLKRIISSPSDRKNFFISKVLVFMVFLIVQLCVLFTVNMKFFNVHYGNILKTAVLCLAFGIFQTLMAMCASLSPRNNAVKILNIANQFLLFIGGGYIPVENISSILSKLPDLSPVRWINKGLFDSIYGGSMTNYWRSMASSLLLGAVFLVIGYSFYRKIGVEHVD